MIQRTGAQAVKKTNAEKLNWLKSFADDELVFLLSIRLGDNLLAERQDTEEKHNMINEKDTRKLCVRTKKAFIKIAEEMFK
jgi:hypothetical protein